MKEETPQWEREFDDFMNENGSPEKWEAPDIDEKLRAFIKSTLEEVIEKIHECCDGECYHDDCCGKLSCVKAQLRKEFL